VDGRDRADGLSTPAGTTGVGSHNLYNSGPTTATTETVNGLPTNGVTVYARLWSYINQKWQTIDYTYTAQ